MAGTWQALRRYRRTNLVRTTQTCAWPGNIRELRAEVARWLVFCEERVELADLSPEIQLASDERPSGAGRRSRDPLPTLTTRAGKPRPLSDLIDELEQRAIHAALSRNQGNLSRTARELGIDRNTLKRKLPERS